MSEDQIVYVVSTGGGNGGRNRVHTDPECQHLQQARQYFEKERSVVDDDNICTVCAGTAAKRGSRPGQYTHETKQALTDMNPEDLGLSAIGERGGQR